MADEADDGEPGDQSKYYPTNQMPLAGQLPDTRREFNQAREEFLLAYSFRTARAYWSDLEQIADWAEERGKDVLALTEKDMRQYAALLWRRRYSENTIRRRLLCWKLFAQRAPKRGQTE